MHQTLEILPSKTGFAKSHFKRGSPVKILIVRIVCVTLWKLSGTERLMFRKTWLMWLWWVRILGEDFTDDHDIHDDNVFLTKDKRRWNIWNSDVYDDTADWEMYQKEVFHVRRSADDIRSAFGADYFIQPCPVENFNQTFVISMKRPGFR